MTTTVIVQDFTKINPESHLTVDRYRDSRIGAAEVDRVPTVGEEVEWDYGERSYCGTVVHVRHRAGMWPPASIEVAVIDSWPKGEVLPPLEDIVGMLESAGCYPDDQAEKWHNEGLELLKKRLRLTGEDDE